VRHGPYAAALDPGEGERVVLRLHRNPIGAVPEENGRMRAVPLRSCLVNDIERHVRAIEALHID
jgi:hypothetical protein